MTPEAMSEAQKDALKKAFDILDEHFEASLMVVAFETSDHTDGFKLARHGGFAAAIGLARYAEYLLRNTKSQEEIL